MKLLDTTLRDGSYVIDFQFTDKDTAVISSLLDDAGVHYIEVGHGLGLYAGTKEEMKAAVTDEAYLEAASKAIKKAKWGMFFIPGIGRMEDIELAAKYKMDFIRIGTNVSEISKSEPFIKKAKDLGMYVCANYMKTYALSPDDVGRQAAISEKYGADLVCVVDSAGGMFPDDVEAYFNAIRKYSKVAIGFHGHNNLGLAVANTLKAVELGADIVDTSVRGMGRSAGNTVTEIFLLAIKRKGIDLHIDVNKILNLADKHIDPFLKNYNQLDSIGIISGYAQFHSSFLGKVLDYSKRYRIDPRELIIRLTSIDKVNAPDELLDKLSAQLRNEKQGTANEINVLFSLNKKNNTVHNDPISFEEKFNQVTNQLGILAKKTSKIPVLNIVQANETTFVSQFINEGSNYLVSTVHLNIVHFKKLIPFIDGRTEVILLDIDNKFKESANWISEIRNLIKKSTVIYYSDLEVWARAIKQIILEITEVTGDKKLLIYGKHPLLRLLTVLLDTMGYGYELYDKKMPAKKMLFQSVLFLSPVNIEFDKICMLVKNESFFLDGIVGALNERQIQWLKTMKKAKILRVNMHPYIQGELLSSFGVHNQFDASTGISEIKGITISSGSWIAPMGTVLTDSITNPTRIIGIADGKGFLLPVEEYSDQDIKSIDIIEKHIAFNF